MGDLPLHLLDLLPSIHELFQIYDSLYFDDKLTPQTVLEWSDRMTRCAGICYLKDHLVVIRLSRRLLQLRPFSDTINTLLHEMIHAYLFVTAPRASYIDRDGHGPAFMQLAGIVNARAGSAVTTHHGFRDEVASLQRHQWRCTGPCQHRPPYYGWVRRAMNRPPQPADRWFKDHLATCGGTFVKVGWDGAAPHGAENAAKCPICGRTFASQSTLQRHAESCSRVTFVIDE